MMDETKKLIAKVFHHERVQGEAYSMWFSNDYTMAMSQDREGKVEFCLDYKHATYPNAWISEEEGLRLLRLKAFW